MSRISIKALTLACHKAIWFVVVATIAAESYAPVKDFLTGLTGHHWTAKGIIALVVFFLTAFVFSKKEDPDDLTGLVIGVIISALAGALAIFGFYMLHFHGIA